MNLPTPLPLSKVPLIGQPFAIHGWFPVVTATHNCQQPTPLTLLLGVTQVCPGCQQFVTLQGYRLQPDGQIGFQIAVVSQGTPKEIQ